MGDVLTLIEKAEAAVEVHEQARLEQQMLAGEFTFDDFLSSYRLLRKMGSLKGVLSMIPVLGSAPGSTSTSRRWAERGDRPVDDSQVTPDATPHRRVSAQADAAGSGNLHSAGEPADLGSQADAEMMKQMKKGKMPGTRRNCSSRHNNSKEGDRAAW